MPSPSYGAWKVIESKAMTTTPKRPFSHWPVSPTPIFGEPRWAVGRWSPHMIIQTDDEATVQRIVDALNAQDEENSDA